MTSLRAAIYGVSWNKSASPILTRTDDAVGMVAAAGVGPTPVLNHFDTAEIYRKIREVTDPLGNVFMRIPRIYIRETDGAGYRTWQISERYFDGAYLPWCFWDFSNNRPTDYIDVGKYVGSLSGENKLQSVAGSYPLVYKSMVDSRGYALANGAGYQLLDLSVVHVLQVLFRVEFATLKCQSVMAGFTTGYLNAAHRATVAENNTNRFILATAYADLFQVGQPVAAGTSAGAIDVFYGRDITSIDVYDASNKAISFDGAPVNIAVGNYICNGPWKNGFSSGIIASSGSLVSNTDGKHPCVFRGIENLWGSSFQYVDGVNVRDYQAWVCENPDQYASNQFASPYEMLSYVNHSANGYITAMGFDPNHPWAEFPVAVGGTADTYYTDNYYRATGDRAVLFGGHMFSAAYAGLTLWGMNILSTDVYIYFSPRLARKVN